MNLQHNKKDKTDMRLLDKDGNVLGYIKEFREHGNTKYRASVTIHNHISSGVLNSLQDAIGYIVSEKGLMTFTEWCQKLEERKNQ